MERRTFLKSGVAIAGGGLLARTTAASAATGIDVTPPSGWDYPAEVSLLPFGHGVASGDPLADRVILWTRVTVPDAAGWNAARPQGFDTIDVAWTIATDPELRNVVGSGKVVTTRALDWTVKVDAAGLKSATTYFYAFAALGFRSPVGRTRTAPAPGAAITELRFAHLACTSWWSTDFHFFRRIAERNDLDLLLHSGDHVYDFVDDSQWYRARNDRFDETYVDFREWTNADEAGRRYALYYADADLLAAHASLPWCVIPDNHDFDDTVVEGVTTFSRGQSAEVMWAWTPMRPPLGDGSGQFGPSPGPNEQVPIPRGTASLQLYRSLPYGDLVDVVAIDMRTFQSEPSAGAALGGEPPIGSPIDPAVDDILGPTQEAWLYETMSASQRRGTKFRVVLNGVNMSQVKATVPLETQLATLGIELGTDGGVYPNGWDQWPASRRRFYRHLRSNGIVDNIVLTGDAHGFFASDLVEDNQLPSYEPLTGGGLLGAVGVEMQPGGGGRVNLQGTVAREAYAAANGHKVHGDYANYMANWFPTFGAAAEAVEALALAGNPNLRYLDWRNYGYSVVHITATHAVLEAWQVPMPQRTDAQTLTAQFRTNVGAPHLRALTPAATAGSRVATAAPAPVTMRVAPAADELPATGGLGLPVVALTALGAALAARAGLRSSQARQVAPDAVSGD